MAVAIGVAARSPSTDRLRRRDRGLAARSRPRSDQPGRHSDTSSLRHTVPKRSARKALRTDAQETIVIRGLRATALNRTLADLCRRRPEVKALVAIDMALHRRLTDGTALPCAGTRRLRALAALAAPAESPMETRLRWLLIDAGLSRPEVQKGSA